MMKRFKRQYLSAINMNDRLKDDGFTNGIYDCFRCLRTADNFSISITDTHIGKTIPEFSIDDNVIVIHNEDTMTDIYNILKYQFYCNLIVRSSVELRTDSEVYITNYTLPKDIVVVWNYGSDVFYTITNITISMKNESPYDGRLDERMFIVSMMCYCIYGDMYIANKWLSNSDIFNKVYTKVLIHFDMIGRSYKSYAKEHWPWLTK